MGVPGGPRASLEVSLGTLGGASGTPGGSLEGPWGVPGGSLEVPGWTLGSLGPPRGPLGLPMGSPGGALCRDLMVKPERF